jgi:hypothetical protein
LVTLKVLSPLAPNLTLGNTRLLTEVVRSTTPVPLSAGCCGLVLALSVRVSVALCAPSASGVNATPREQLVEGATVIGIGPQVPVPLNAYSGSDAVALETTSGWILPLLVTVRLLVTV